MRVGFTGTREGMSVLQVQEVRRLVSLHFDEPGKKEAHHGDCTGADERFHDIVHVHRNIAQIHDLDIVAHPGPPSRWSAGCGADIVRDPKPYLERNRDIVHESDVMIAAPLELETKRGGTWSTIRLARRALLEGRLYALHIVGRDGSCVTHTQLTMQATREANRR